MRDGAPLLELRDVSRRFGGLIAVDRVTMAVTANTVHGLIGPNGAGKSSTFDLISGLTPVSSGTIYLEGRDITRLAVERRVAAGICRTFQTPRLFEEMTALETVMTGRHIHGRTGILASMFTLGAKRRDEAATLAEAHHLLDVVGLADAAETPASGLSYGRRRLLEIARALATRPRLLLLDEVASGLNPVETDAVAALIRRLVAEGLTIVLVEHDMRFVMGICDRITVLNFGAKIADGSPEEIAGDENVVTAYLGRPREGGEARRARREADAAAART